MTIKRRVYVHHPGITKILPIHEAVARHTRKQAPSLARGPFNPEPAATARLAVVHLNPAEPFRSSR